LGNVSPCESLEELMVQSDVISVHIDGRPENNDLIGASQFDMMKPGVIFLNLSRGNVVNYNALKSAIQSGKVAGAGVDVFPKEPMSNEDEFISELRGLPNTILTPHIGGSTLEAQKNIASFVPSRIIDYINTGSTSNTVGFPDIALPILNEAHRFIHIHVNAAGVLAKINNILANHKLNIVGQYLKTNENIGYVITDIDKKYDKEVIKELKGIDETIRFRVLY
ncbi:MAG: phosphoglycerate dehydrogenase, partial [Flammeovirgaceae bacterium]|nr:phosphoglycerate dehydrogenase [Flammeovirgaceae bacterium]